MNSTNIFMSGVSSLIAQRLAIAIKVPVKVLCLTKHPVYDSIACNLKKNSIPDNALEDIETVFHLARFSHDFRDADKILNLYKQVNVNATIDLASLLVKGVVKKFLFDMASLINSRIKYKLNNLLSDEFYSSTKLEALRLIRFKAIVTLKGINETSF